MWFFYIKGLVTRFFFLYHSTCACTGRGQQNLSTSVLFEDKTTRKPDSFMQILLGCFPNTTQLVGETIFWRNNPYIYIFKSSFGQRSKTFSNEILSLCRICRQERQKCTSWDGDELFSPLTGNHCM